MGVSRWTCLAIQGNVVRIIDGPDRCEAWIEHDGEPHALVLSCPLDKRADLEKAIADIKAMTQQEIFS